MRNAAKSEMMRKLGAICLAVLLLCGVTGAAEKNDDAAQWRSTKVQKAALQLARQSVSYFLKTGKTLAIPGKLPAPLLKRGAVFITIEKRGRIAPRGCRGTLQATYKNVADEIIHNAVAAASRDISEPPLRRDELGQCLISITVIQRIFAIQSIAQHDAENNGLIAQSGARIGIVLPFEGHDARTQLIWAKRKAGLKDDAAVQLKEMFAVRFRES